MIKNYLKIAWRNLNKHKLFSFINIFGLASGMAVCMLALMKIKDAYDYDTFHPNSQRSYRVITNLDRKNGEHFLCASSPLPLSQYLKNNYSAIEKSTSVYFDQQQVTANDRQLSAKEAYVDEDFYKIFGFQLIAGSPAIKPQTTVLTNETAERFFGKENPIGKIITIGQSQNFLVTGILGKPPHHSHLTFDLLASTSSLPLLKGENVSQNWSDEARAYTYVQLKEGVFEQSLKNVLSDVNKHVNKTFLPSATGKTFVFDSQPLNQISPGTVPMYNTTNEPILPNLIALALIGFSMLLLAFFNYVNLTLARSLDRAREVGIRKVAGALKYQLMMQFLSESVLVSILAFCLAQVLLRFIMTLPTVQNIIGDIPQDKTLWSYFIVFTIATGLLAGWIPAKVLSGYQPARVLKGRFNTKLFGGVGLRKALTVVQFAASLIAIVVLAVFDKQSVYMATADYGFNQQHIVNINLPVNAYEKTATAFTAVPGVEKVSGTSALFGFSGGDTKFIKPDKTVDSISAAYFSVTPSFVNNLGLRVIAGKNLPEVTSEKGTQYVLINEEATRILHFKNPSDAAGKLIWINDSTQYVVSGVVKDFHYANFLRPVQPLVLSNVQSDLSILNIKVAKGAEQNIMPSLEKAWKKLYPNQPFEAAWFDKQLYEQNLHKDDLMFIGVLTIMALSIACLGLLGMVIYTTKNREKEVGIRRVMGAKVWQVIITISKEFIMLLVISVLIGLPIGIVTGKAFLQQYAYQVTIGFSIIAGSAALMLLLGAITIGWQTYRTALGNPVKSLRTE
jgi:putative ABC transport system permease protein